MHDKEETGVFFVYTDYQKRTPPTLIASKYIADHELKAMCAEKANL